MFSLFPMENRYKKLMGSYPTINLPIEVDGHGYILDGVPLEEEEIAARIQCDVGASMTTLRLLQQFRRTSSRAQKAFFGSILLGILLGYITFLALRGDMWLWMLGFAFVGVVAGIVGWTVIRSDANDILRLLVDSYNQDRGFNASDYNPDEDNDMEDG
jgi:hypothetical protein